MFFNTSMITYIICFKLGRCIQRSIHPAWIWLLEVKTAAIYRYLVVWGSCITNLLFTMASLWLYHSPLPMHHLIWHIWLRSAKYGSNLKSIIFKLIIQTHSLSNHSKITLWEMSCYLTYEKSTIVEIITLEAREYLSQYWPRSMWPYVITRHGKLIPLSKYSLNVRYSRNPL